MGRYLVSKNLNATEKMLQGMLGQKIYWLDFGETFWDSNGTKSGGRRFDLEGYFPLEFSYSVVRASVQGNLSSFPT